MCISSPYARRGALWQAYEKHYGQDGDPVLVWRAGTRSMNLSIDCSIIEAAYEEDEPAASAEYGAEFRRDVETFVSREAVQACVGDYLERAYDSRYVCRAFVDVAGGSGQDSYTMAIAHPEGDHTVIDAVREVRPPFNPEVVTNEMCSLLKTYGIHGVYAL